MDTPVKRFSSGMLSRLSFAIAMQFPADIYVFDEVLAVVDGEFQAAASTRSRPSRRRPHGDLREPQPRQVAEVCERVIWLERGVCQARRARGRGP